MTLQLHHLFYFLLATAILLYLFVFFYNRHTLAYKFRTRNYVAFYNAVMCNHDLTDVMRTNRRALFLKQRPSMLRLMIYGRPFILNRYYSDDQISFFFSRQAKNKHRHTTDHVKSRYDFAVFDKPVAMLATGKYVNGVLTPVNK